MDGNIEAGAFLLSYAENRDSLLREAVPVFFLNNPHIFGAPFGRAIGGDGYRRLSGVLA